MSVRIIHDSSDALEPGDQALVLSTPGTIDEGSAGLEGRVVHVGEDQSVLLRFAGDKELYTGVYGAGEVTRVEYLSSDAQFVEKLLLDWSW